LPPVEAWKYEQRAALDEIADVIAELVVREIFAEQVAGTTADTKLGATPA
jgi:hypothetical protein